MTPEQREELKAAAHELQVIYAQKPIPNCAEAVGRFRKVATPSAILSLIAQVEALTVPQGWKAMPDDPTMQMRRAGNDALGKNSYRFHKDACGQGVLRVHGHARRRPHHSRYTGNEGGGVSRAIDLAVCLLFVAGAALCWLLDPDAP